MDSASDWLKKFSSNQRPCPVFMGSDVSSVCQPISSTDPDLDSDASYVSKEYLGPFLRLYFAEKPVAALRGVGYFLRIFYTQAN